MRSPVIVRLLVLGPMLAGVLTGCSGQRSPSTAPSSSPAPKESPAVASSDEPSPTLHAGGLTGHLVYSKAGGVYGEATYFTSNADGTHEGEIPGPPEETGGARVNAEETMLLYAGFPDTSPGQPLRVTVGIQPLDGVEPPRYLPLPDTLNLGPGAWSPDGSRIAVQGWDKAHPNRDGMYLVDSDDGGHRVRLTKERDGVNHSPSDFSPDGKRLVFLEEHTDTQGAGQLFIMDIARQGRPRPLTPPDFGANGSARFSPDGELILFADGRLSTRGAIWTVRPDGRGLHKVWDHADYFAGSPAWSPDGRQIVFSLNDIANEFEHWPNALAIINADGTNLREIVRDGDFRREITWIH
jgi:WD40-like Beta Propeller Repeat